MSLIQWAGLSVYLMGHGWRGTGITGSSLSGSVFMIVGGAVVLIGALI